MPCSPYVSREQLWVARWSDGGSTVCVWQLFDPFCRYRGQFCLFEVCLVIYWPCQLHTLCNVKSGMVPVCCTDFEAVATISGHYFSTMLEGSRRSTNDLRIVYAIAETVYLYVPISNPLMFELKLLYLCFVSLCVLFCYFLFSSLNLLKPKARLNNI
jgi:hypothetical protein